MKNQNFFFPKIFNNSQFPWIKASFFLRDQFFILRSETKASALVPKPYIKTSSTGSLSEVYPAMDPS
jgi:hypothetical protein